MQSQILDLYQENKTPQYHEIIEYYEVLAKENSISELKTYGTTDAGYPLHLFIIDSDKDFDPAISKAKGKTILLINNGIHPGEPDGIDACLQLTNNLLVTKSWQADLSHLVICIIPIYNVDGCLNRNSISRVNQDGPEEYGFRGNDQNLDLNRDFIKCDSKNAQAFTTIFRTWDPDLFVDTHVSNGADYQYVMTLIATQHNKLTPPLNTFLNNHLLPYLYDGMNKGGFPMCPYVEPIKEIPDNGIAAFLETPRYSTGYAALFNTIGFMPETHMLKPYPNRVEATLLLLQTFLEFASTHYSALLEARRDANAFVANAKSLPVHWQIDLEQKDQFIFSGYEAKYKTSEVTGAQRLWYDRNAPYTKSIDYFNTYNPDIIIELPDFYILPKAWYKVVERLQWNNITMIPLDKDTLLEVEVYYIQDYKTIQKPFEGHYLHYDTEIKKEIIQIQLHAGDWMIPLNQNANKYIVEMLEPQSADAFFNWNFFDPILSRKEWYSDYVFEDVAAELLQTDANLRTAFEKKKQDEPTFAESPALQLEFIFENSKYKEASYNRYPVLRYFGKWK
ncbi:MAG: M14 family zinc carboxypeptidase [Chitinophagales bacterium]|nr:hypothetical protein [Bacteroidota bacterium]